MSDCCLPNLGCLSIPIKSTEINGPIGLPGDDGRGIVFENYEPSNGQLTFTFTEAPFTYTTGDLRGGPGIQGGAGIDGVARLYSNTIEGFSSVLNDFDEVAQYVLPANTLVNDGDALIINLRSVKTSNAGNNPYEDCQRRIRFNSTSCTLFLSAEVAMITNSSSQQYNTRVEIIKTGINTARCNVVSDYDIIAANNFPPYFTYQLNLTVLDFTISNTISADIYQAASGQSRTKTFTIDKIKVL